MASLPALGARAALAAASVALTLLGLEAALRLSGYVPEQYAHTNRIANRGRTVLLDCYPTNPRGYFDLDLRHAGTRARYRALGLARLEEAARETPHAVERRYSAQQFRSPEIGPRREGVRRVVVFGDSFTEGMGVREDDTYARVLHRALSGGRAAGDGGWEVFNCGRRGYDFPALFDLFETVLGFDPDVIVYGMVLNDAVRSDGFQARQAYLNDWILDRGRMVRGEEEARRARPPSRLAAFVADRIQTARVGRETTRWYRDMYGEPNRDGWERTQGYLREMHTRAQARGARLVVASWPLLVGLEGRYPFADVSDEIARFCLQAGLERHDLLPALAGRPSATLWVHPVDHHPNEVAHRLAAESLVPVVRRLAGLRARAGAPAPDVASPPPAAPGSEAPAARPGPSPRP